MLHPSRTRRRAMLEGMTLHLPRRSFASLSVKDLIDAREAYHTHLLHLENVVATAIGRYRFVRTDPDDPDGLEPPKGGRGRDDERTLANSEVRPYSWPCVMVFVDTWIPKKDFAAKFDAIVPPRLYLADGRVVPTCVIKSQKQDQVIGEVQTLRFPDTALGGGYPSLADVQGQTRVATIGCLVSDGDNLYALTNSHVTGDDERELFTLVRGRRERLGRTPPGRRLGKIPFERAYPGFAGPSSVLNLDAALVRVDDVRRWTSQVYGIGQFDELADLNVNTVSLDLIGCKLVAFGAASGLMCGEVQGFFYRYRSIGGQDQLADLLIGPRPAADPPRRDPREPARKGQMDEHVQRCEEMAGRLGRHGNSGTIWFLEQPDDDGQVHRRPIGLHWGGQSFVAGDRLQATQYALASSLGVICRELDVDLVRDVRIGLAERWGQVGHYRIGQLACRLDTQERLQTLLHKNVNRISFAEDIDDKFNEVGKDEEFIPLADVPDLVWKHGGQSVRGAESPNHFADMDQPSPAFGDKTLLELNEEDGFLDPERWNQFYESLDVAVNHRATARYRVSSPPPASWPTTSATPASRYTCRCSTTATSTVAARACTALTRRTC